MISSAAFLQRKKKWMQRQIRAVVPYAADWVFDSTEQHGYVWKWCLPRVYPNNCRSNGENGLVWWLNLLKLQDLGQMTRSRKDVSSENSVPGRCLSALEQWDKENPTGNKAWNHGRLLLISVDSFSGRQRLIFFNFEKVGWRKSTSCWALAYGFFRLGTLPVLVMSGWPRRWQSTWWNSSFQIAGPPSVATEQAPSTVERQTAVSPRWRKVFTDCSCIMFRVCFQTGFVCFDVKRCRKSIHDQILEVVYSLLGGNMWGPQVGLQLQADVWVDRQTTRARWREISGASEDVEVHSHRIVLWIFSFSNYLVSVRGDSGDFHRFLLNWRTSAIMRCCSVTATWAARHAQPFLLWIRMWWTMLLGFQKCHDQRVEAGNGKCITEKMLESISCQVGLHMIFFWLFQAIIFQKMSVCVRKSKPAN